MADPKIGVAYSFSVVLVNAANRPTFLAAPPIAAGDFQVSIDAGGYGNLAALPAPQPAATESVLISLSAGEMTGARIKVRGIDPDAVWDPVFIEIQPTAQTIDDVPTSAQNADRLLGRNIGGGSDTGRTVQQALRAIRNLRQIVAGIFTVFREDDTTPDWTATVTTTPGNPIDKIDPT